MTMTLVPALLLQQEDFPAAAGGAAIAGMGLVMMLVMMVITAVFIIGMWKLYVKAGQPGWASLVPVYNIVVLLQIVGRPVWWVVLFFVPFVNFVMMLLVMIDLAKSFGQGAGMVVLMLLGGIGFLALGFGGARYLGPAAAGGTLTAGAAV